MPYQRNSHCSYCGQPFAAGQPWPRVCSRCGNTSYINPLPVAVVIVPVDAGVLLVRRAIPPYLGGLALPGGFIDYGESWQQAGAREVYEELGVIVLPDAIEHLWAASAPDSTLLVFGVAAPLRTAELPPFVPNSEASERLLVVEPVELAFSLHTLALRMYFSRNASVAVQE